MGRTGEPYWPDFRKEIVGARWTRVAHQYGRGTIWKVPMHGMRPGWRLLVVSAGGHELWTNTESIARAELLRMPMVNGQTDLFSPSTTRSPEHGPNKGDRQAQ